MYFKLFCNKLLYDPFIILREIIFPHQFLLFLHQWCGNNIKGCGNSAAQYLLSVIIFEEPTSIIWHIIKKRCDDKKVIKLILKKWWQLTSWNKEEKKR